MSGLIRTRTAAAFAFGAALLAALALAPAGISAEEAAGTCTDTAWANYNECLMSSGGFEWARRECDVEFQSEYVACYGKTLIGIFAVLKAL